MHWFRIRIQKKQFSPEFWIVAERAAIFQTLGRPFDLAKGRAVAVEPGPACWAGSGRTGLCERARKAARGRQAGFQERGIEIAHAADIFFCSCKHYQKDKPGDFGAYSISFQWSSQAPLTN